jgi:hypothetical protein
MIYRRGAMPALVLLALVLLGAIARIVGGPATSSPAALPPPRAAGGAARAASPPARAVVRTLDAVQRAFNAGYVAALCRPGGLVDPAVIHLQDEQAGGCHSELESLIADGPPMRLTVASLVLRGDLATATSRRQAA